MPRQFIAKALAPDAVDKAFALARSGASALSPEQWRSYAINLIQRGGAASGVLTLENRAGTIQGLCGYRIEPSLGQGSVCSVELLVALDLIDNEAVMAALLKAMEALARRQGAVALRLDLPYGTATTKQLLCRLDKNGHRVDRIRLLKQLGAVN